MELNERSKKVEDVSNTVNIENMSSIEKSHPGK